MQPGLSRAVPMAFIGFLFGALLVIVIRGLQQLDPLWAAGPGIVLSAFMMAGFFVWGMGAFDPKLSVHGEAAEEAAHEAQAEETEKPQRLLIGSVWQLAALLIVLLVVLGGFAALPHGLAMTQTISDYASPTMVGFVPFDLPFGGPTIYVSQLVLFAIFIIVTLLSLVAAAAIIGWIIVFMSRGVTEASVIAKGGTIALPPPSETSATGWRANPRIHGLITVVIFLVTFVVLYLVFYYVAIGLILPKPEIPGLSLIFPDPSAQLAIISLVNAAIFTLVILRTQLVLAVIGRVAGWLAHVLRSVPKFLQ